MDNLSTDNPAASLVSTSASTPDFRQYVSKLLFDLCAIDTTPRGDLADLAASEERAFGIIEKSLRALEWNGDVHIARVPIDPAIQQHAFYSRPYYTITPDHAAEASAKEAYAGRCNLVVTIDPGSASGAADPAPAGLALNAHIDVVRPYIAPRIAENILYGRGACDDKGPAVSIIGAVKLVCEHLQRLGKTLRRPLTLMFVIDEEMGGNGSLSLAINRELRKRYDALAVLECCSSNIFPGNRGAVWYKVQGGAPGMNLFEASAFIVGELEREGRAIKAESRHDLFPQRPVQTCHGILGSWGEHPSRICGRVDFLIRAGDEGSLERVQSLIRDVLDDGLAQYTALYGDKTKVIDPATGRPKVDHHYNLSSHGNELQVSVHGATGHMGAILLNDGAITKMATMVRSLIASRPTIERAAGGRVWMELAGPKSDPSALVMEGGQGFLPTHSMTEVMDRLRQAVWHGARLYAALTGQHDFDAPKALAVTFDKLHNAAFAGDPNSAVMQSAIAAATSTGLWTKGQDIRGWEVSCDARIFACEYPDLSVITTGPGHLVHAHADNEQIDLDELARFAGFLADFIVRQVL